MSNLTTVAARAVAQRLRQLHPSQITAPDLDQAAAIVEQLCKLVEARPQQQQPQRLGVTIVADGRAHGQASLQAGGVILPAGGAGGSRYRASDHFKACSSCPGGATPCPMTCTAVEEKA